MSKVSEQRRREILEAAGAEFRERGLESSSMADIAQRAGVGKSTLYEYFPSKAELLANTCEQILQELETSICTVFAEESSFRLQLEGYCATILHATERVDIESARKFFSDSTAFQRLTEQVQGFSRDILRQMEDAVRSAQNRGELSMELDVPVTAMYLLSLPNPHMGAYLRSHGYAAPERIMAELVLGGLAAEKKKTV